MAEMALDLGYKPADLLPGYYRDEDTGAWMTLPWPKNLEDLPLSLGPQAIQWAESNLIHHITGEPWTFTRGQKRFLYLWFAVDEEGEWIYTNGCKRGAKGTGKDPFLSALLHISAWGPCVFSHFENGFPVGKRKGMALVQIGANSEDQAKDVLRVANAMISAEMSIEYMLDPGLLVTQSRDGSRIEVLRASERSMEGDPATDAFLNETHHMVPETPGAKAAAVARRNVEKSPVYIKARLLEFTNAHHEGEESIAEATYDAWQASVAGRTTDMALLYDSVEADPGLDIADDKHLVIAVDQAYLDSPWTDKRRIRRACRDVRTPVADIIRYFFNGLGTSEDAWVDARIFDSLAKPDEEVVAGTKITMFLDCSKSGDATALVGCRISDGYVFTVGIWQSVGSKRKEWRAPREAVDLAVREAFATYRVIWFGVDISAARDDTNTDVLYWQPLCDAWHRDFKKKVRLWAMRGEVNGHSVIFDMRMDSYGGKTRNKQFTETAMAVVTEIEEEKTLRHDGNHRLRSHVHSARRRPNEWGVTLSKKNQSSRYFVDAATAMVGAKLGRRLALNSGKVRAQSSNSPF